MLTSAEVLELARACGVTRDDAAVLEPVRPGWRLEPDVNGPHRVGGPAPLALDEPWPVNGRGVALSFLGVIDPRAFPPLDHEWAPRLSGRPPDAPMRIFWDGVENPYEPAPAFVLLQPLDREVRWREAPAIPSSFPPGEPWKGLTAEERVRDLPERRLRAVPFVGVAVSSVDEDDAWCEFANRLRVDGDTTEAAAGHPVRHPEWPWEAWQTFGMPAGVQDDPRLGIVNAFGSTANVPRDAGDWIVLLEVHADQELPILDGGAYTVMVPRADLAVGDFSRAACSVDSG
jgi:hypothetical protein